MQVTMLTRSEYVETVVDFLELVPPTCIVERIQGEAPPDYFVAPSWCLDKPSVKRAIEQEFALRGSWQGRLSS